MPSPVIGETGNTGIPASELPENSSSISSEISTARVSSTRSTLVNATAPCDTSNRSRMARCSRVCGIGPSSAATMNKTKSIPATPHNILRMNFSCPGTSMKPIVSASSTGKKAKPRSIVRLRFFSSGRRSVSTPVSDFISSVLPWSTWPAVAIIIAAA